jgi:glycerol-3-phosphate acyltransferase PlsY
MWQLIASVVLCYLIGSIPTGFITAKLARRIDIRRFGSGNVGATNTFRVLGKTAGIAVLIVDILKGVVAVVVIGNHFCYDLPVSAGIYRMILGLAVISGHNWTVFLKFRGGKGVATTAGVLIGLGLTRVFAPLLLAIPVVVWVVVFATMRYVSLASIVGAISLPVAACFTSTSTVWAVLFCAVIALMVVYRHKSNIRRLLVNQENRAF